MNLFERSKKKYGSVIIDSVEYALMQDAYYDNDATAPAGVSFVAAAISKKQLAECEGEFSAGFDSHALITWYPCQEWVDGEHGGDDGSACNWGNPDLIDEI